MSSLPKRQARWVSLDQLHEDPANVRKHGERNRAAVRASLSEFGQVEPLVVQAGTGRVLGGNCRLAELRALGQTEALVLEIDVAGVDATRLALALNQTAVLAEWDEEGLEKLLRDLSAEGLEVPGFDEEALAELLKDSAPPVVQEDEDAPLPLPVEPASRLGEVYELGPHRLVCGDCRLAETWALLMGGGSLDIAWTDPPYGVAVNQVESPEEARRLRRRTDGMIVQNDALVPAELRQLLADSLGMLVAHLKPGGVVYAAAPAGPLHNIFGEVLIDLEIWRRSLIWLKDIFALGRGDYHYRHEPIFYGWKPGAAHYFVDDRTQDTVLEFDRPKRSGEHPTMKPVPLVERCLMNSSRLGEVVGDPFGGSGTTLIAAAQTGRIARLIELDPRYCDVIRRRWTRWARANNRDPGPGALGEST